jgi:NCS2 family nucleobase:cation symporter-2
MINAVVRKLEGAGSSAASKPQKIVRKPANLIYATGDAPPAGTTVLLGLQHAVESASKAALPVGLLVAAGTAGSQLEGMIAAILIFSGLASILVSSRLPKIGFGHLLPSAIFSSFAAPAVMLTRVGGLPLLAGMTLVSAGTVAVLSRILPRWRFLFPPEVVGLIAFMVGASQASVAVTRFLGMERLDQTPNRLHILIASASLALLAALTVWGKGKLRLFSTIITLVGGYVACVYTHLMPPAQWQRVIDAPWIGLPHLSPPGFAFQSSLILPFAILGLSSALKSAGDLTISEKISDADWKRSDMKAGSAALLCFGLCSFFSAALGGIMLGSSSSNVGLSAATGAVSRRIGYACGGILLALAFLPKLVALIGAAPPPVVGAMFVLVVSYNLIAGMQIIMSRLMEARHTYIIGLSLLFGLTADAMPGVFQGLPPWLRAVLSSGLALSTILVVLLNLIFRIGTAKRHTIVLVPGQTGSDRIFEFGERAAAEWGARREVAQRAVGAMAEAYELISGEGLADGPISLSATFDEFSLDVLMRYPGRLPVTDAAPLRPEDLLEGRFSAAGLATMLLNGLSDRVRTRIDAGLCELELHFEH